MSDNEYDISRRKILGSIGAIGAAGALGGGATGALLWDEETFGNSTNPNLLQAGELDLKVDWAEHYVDWIGAETQVDGVRMVDGPDDLAADEVGLPTPDHPMLAVKETDTDGNGTPQIDEFMAATTTETSDDFDGPDDKTVDNAPDLVDQPDPVITIQDVKPGDFGEVTLSYHVFGNPAFVSLCADVVADDDHSSVEPELSAGDDPEDENDDRDGELGDLVQAAAWYDPNCNNRFDGGEVEVMVAFDLSDSLSGNFPGATNDIYGETRSSNINGDQVEAMVQAASEEFLRPLQNTCGPNVRVGAVSYGDRLVHNPGVSASLDVQLTSDYGDTNDPIEDWLGDDGNTSTDDNDDYQLDSGNEMVAGLEKAHDAILNPSDGGTESTAADLGEARKVIVFVTDGQLGPASERGNLQAEANNVKSKGIDLYPVQINTDNFDDAYWSDISSDGKPRRAESYTELSTIHTKLTENICATAGSEQRIAGPAPIGQVLGDLAECLLLDPTAAGSATSTKFDGPCHQPTNTGCVALAWWLPRDIPGVNDNVVQTDSFEFTMSFNAVQCRHNVTDEGEPIDEPGSTDVDSDANG